MKALGNFRPFASPSLGTDFDFFTGVGNFETSKSHYASFGTIQRVLGLANGTLGVHY